MRKIFLYLLFFISSFSVFAIPAKRSVNTVFQKDGSKLEVILKGDESFHFFSTTDGLPLIKTNTGYYYAKFNDGILSSTNVLAHNIHNRDISETSFLAFGGYVNKKAIYNHWTERSIARNSHRLSRGAQNKKNSSAKINKRANTQSLYKKGLVILVNFSDTAFTYMQSDIDLMFNKEGYNKNKHIGSVHDYFKDQSYGQLLLDFDVVGPYTLSHKMSYYGENNSQGDDKYAGQMIAEACNLANKDVDFSKYDWDSDGEVEQIYVIYAGYGEASQAPSTTVWPHEWTLSSSDYGKSLSLDGVTLDTYACSNELTGNSGKYLDGIGTACHEFSHCLGLPDFYDTSGSSFGMATWSIMDYGCYNGPLGYEGNVPAAYTAYERFYSGWIDPTILDKGCEIKGMRAITESDDSYIIYNEKYSNEYYILTNIQKTSWNTYAEGHGLLIMHIDYDEDAWFNNSVNDDANHQRCTIIAADNKTPSLTSSTAWNSLPGDPYPGTSNNTSLTDTTTPAATLYKTNSTGKKFMNKPIEDIKEDVDGTISFKFNGGTQLDAPRAKEASNITNNSFTAHWDSVENASSYTAELFEVYETDLSLLLSEDFIKLKNSDLPSSTDVSSQLDKYTLVQGWTGSKLSHDSNHGIKMGSSKASGVLTTPNFNAPVSSMLSVYIDASPYLSTTEATFVVSINSQSQEVTCAGTPILVYFSDINDDFKLTIETSNNNKRAYIDEIKLYDGMASIEELSERDGNMKVMAKRSVQTVESIQNTSFTFTNLTSPEYYYRVKALNSSSEIGTTIVSKWSNLIYVQLLSESTIPGDVNKDGIVDISDIVATINHISGSQSFDSADVNNDGAVDISDIVSIINIIATK